MAQLNREYNDLQTKTHKKEYEEAEAKEPSDKIAKKMRTVLDSVVICRTRVDLQKINKYKKDLKAQGSFIGARYMPLAYLKQKGGQIDKRLIAKYSARFNVENFGKRTAQHGVFYAAITCEQIRERKVFLYEDAREHTVINETDAQILC